MTASPRVVLALAQPPAHEGGAPGRCSVGLMRGLVGHGIPVAAVAAHRRGYAVEALDTLPSVVREKVELVEVSASPYTVHAHVDRLRRPVGRLAAGEFFARVRALAQHADLLHLEQLETGWCGFGAKVASVVHLHYRIQMDRRPPAPWARDFGAYVERAAAERRIVRRQRYLVASSGVVADSLRREAPRAEIVVAPLCLDPDHYLPAAHTDPPVVGIIGTGWWAPTAAAIRRLVTQTWPLVRRRSPDARLLVAGHGTANLGLPPVDGVEIVGSVRSGSEFIRSLAVLLYPLDRGSGMKVKVLEAIASGVPVVTTEPGAEGLSTSDGVVIRDSDAALADEVAELLADRSARLQRGAAGRQLFLDEYAPLPATAPLIPLYARMAGT